MHDTNRINLVRSAHTIHRNLGKRRAVHVIRKRMSFFFCFIKMNFGRGVMCVFAEVYTLPKCRINQCIPLKFCLFRVGIHNIIAEQDVGIFRKIQHFLRNRFQTFGKLGTSHKHSFAVQIGSCACGCRRSVGNACGICGFNFDFIKRDSESKRSNLHHLGIHTLSHFHRAGADSHASVLINVYQRTRMVHRRVREGNPEGYRHKRVTFFVIFVF